MDFESSGWFILRLLCRHCWPEYLIGRLVLWRCVEIKLRSRPRSHDRRARERKYHRARGSKNIADVLFQYWEVEQYSQLWRSLLSCHFCHRLTSMYGLDKDKVRVMHDAGHLCVYLWRRLGRPQHPIQRQCPCRFLVFLRWRERRDQLTISMPSEKRIASVVVVVGASCTRIYTIKDDQRPREKNTNALIYIERKKERERKVSLINRSLTVITWPRDAR